MIIKILGSGCKKCVALGENAKAAAAAAGKQAEIVKVTDFAEIAAELQKFLAIRRAGDVDPSSGLPL